MSHRNPGLQSWEQSIKAQFIRASEVGLLNGSQIDTQISHSKSFVKLIPSSGKRILDLGTGIGIPGIIVASILSSSSIFLLDSNQKKINFVLSVKERLSLFNMEVLIGRAEELGRQKALRESFDCVLTRGFGSVGVTAECAAPFLMPGGDLIISAPPSPSLDIWQAEPLKSLGLTFPEVKRVNFNFYHLKKFTSCSDTFPRRVGIPSKRPLF